MSTGIVSTRYAKALLKFVTETGRGEQVYAQVQAMLETPASVPEPLEEDLRKFIALLVSNGRISYLKFIFNSFSRMYRRAHNIKKANLKTAVPSPELETKLKSLVSENGFELVLETEVDPDLIGGFVFQVDDLLMDASVARQIEIIRHQFIEKNNRIV